MTGQSSAATSNNEPPKKYAGKYDTVEDLEKAYNEVGQISRENANLKSEIEKFRSVPDDYALPDGITLQADDLSDLKQIAKSSGLTQDHFNKMAEKMHERAKNSQERYEARKKTVGEDKINVVVDFVKKQFPEQMQDLIINKCIEDDTAMTHIMNQRDKMLNSKAPGIDNAGTGSGGGAGDKGKYDGHKEITELAKEYLNGGNRNGEKLKDRLINLAKEVGHERFQKG